MPPFHAEEENTMKKITRFLFCTFAAIMLTGTAISATACHQKEEYPSVPEVTEPQPTGEIIPTVDRQKELKDARKKYADAVAWLYMPGAEVCISPLAATGFAE